MTGLRISYQFSQVRFSRQQEEQLVEYLDSMDNIFYGLTMDEFKMLVFDFAHNDGILHPFQNWAAGNE